MSHVGMRKEHACPIYMMYPKYRMQLFVEQTGVQWHTCQKRKVHAPRIRSIGCSSLRANGCGAAVLSSWSRTVMVQDRMAQGFGITTGIQEARKGKYTLLGTAGNFNSLLSSGLSSSRLTTVQGMGHSRSATNILISAGMQ